LYERELYDSINELHLLQQFFDFSYESHILSYNLPLSFTMNPKLEKLLDAHNFSAKDRYEIFQIYSLLSTQRKVKFLENFDSIVWEIWVLQQEIVSEQEILFWQTLENIENKIARMKKNQLAQKTREHIDILRWSL